MKAMRIAVVGAGAMGSILGGLLALGGAQVTLIDPYADHMNAIAEKGLTLQIGTETHHISGIRTALAPNEAMGPFDVEVLMVKSGVSDLALTQSACIRDAHTVLASFQNGLGHVDTMEKYASQQKILYGCLHLSGRLVGPGEASCTVVNADQAILIGAADKENAALRQTGERLAEYMNALPGVSSRFSDQAETVVWRKAMLNSALNPLGALLQMTGPALVKNPYTCKLMVQVLDEVAAVALTAGIEGVDAAACREITLPAIAAGKANYPSMALDVAAKRKTEIDQINGAVSAAGKKLGVPTPLCDMLTGLIHAMEAEWKQP